MVEIRARKIEKDVNSPLTNNPVNFSSKKITFEETEYSTGINWIEFIGKIDNFLTKMVINLQDEYIPLCLITSGDFFKNEPLNKNNPWLKDEELYEVAKGVSSEISLYIDGKYKYVYDEIMDKYAGSKDVSRAEREEAMKKFNESLEADSAYVFLNSYNILNNKRNLFNQIMNNMGKFNV